MLPQVVSTLLAKHINLLQYSSFVPLVDLRPSMGDPKSDFIVTMHCVVRAAGSSKTSGKHGHSTRIGTFNNPGWYILSGLCILLLACISRLHCQLVV